MDVELAMHPDNLAGSLDLLREGPSLTLSEFSELSGCSESIIGDCVRELLGCALIIEDGDADEPAPPARAISFCADGGIVLVADLGASRTSGELQISADGSSTGAVVPPISPAAPNLHWPSWNAVEATTPRPTDRRPGPRHRYRCARRGGFGVRSTLGDPLLAGWQQIRQGPARLRIRRSRLGGQRRQHDGRRRTEGRRRPRTTQPDLSQHERDNPRWNRLERQASSR